MLLAQDPKLLLVDEPVAGMTDAETHADGRTAASEINRDQDRRRGRARHGLRARTRRQGHVPARRLGAGRRHDRSGVDRTTASSKCIWECGDRIAWNRFRIVMRGKVRCSKRLDQSHYGAAQALRGVSIAAEPGKVTCVLGRNGVGKTSLLRALVGQQPISGGKIDVRTATTSSRLRAVRARAARHRLCAAGPRDFPAADGGGKSRDRLRAAQARRAHHSRRRVLAVSGAAKHAAAARRRSLRRPAAAARHRPRAGDAAEASAARRADRGHPALDHQGHRPRDRLSARARQDGDRAGRAIFRLRPRARRPVRRDGSRRGDIQLRSRQPRDPRRACSTADGGSKRLDAGERHDRVAASEPRTDLRRQPRLGAVDAVDSAASRGSTPRASVHEAGLAAGSLPRTHDGELRSRADQHRRRHRGRRPVRHRRHGGSTARGWW